MRANADGTLENRSDVYLLLGHSGNSPEFELLDPQTNRITKSQHVKVVESDLSGPGMTPEHGPLEILVSGSKFYSGYVLSNTFRVSETLPSNITPVVALAIL